MEWIYWRLALHLSALFSKQNIFLFAIHQLNCSDVEILALWYSQILRTRKVISFLQIHHPSFTHSTSSEIPLISVYYTLLKIWSYRTSKDIKSSTFGPFLNDSPLFALAATCYQLQLLFATCAKLLNMTYRRGKPNPTPGITNKVSYLCRCWTREVSHFVFCMSWQNSCGPLTTVKQECTQAQRAPNRPISWRPLLEWTDVENFMELHESAEELCKCRSQVCTLLRKEQFMPSCLRGNCWMLSPFLNLFHV